MTAKHTHLHTLSQGFTWGVYMGGLYVYMGGLYGGFIWGPFGGLYGALSGAKGHLTHPSPSCTDVVPSVCENKEARPAPFPWG